MADKKTNQLEYNTKDSGENIPQEPAHDGLLAIIAGKLQMVAPNLDGKWPVITPGDHGEIRYNGQRISKTTVVDNSDALEVFSVKQESSSSFTLQVSSDEMEVRLKTTFRSGAEYILEDTDYTPHLVVHGKLVRQIPPEEIDESLVYQELNQMGVKATILTKVVRDACHCLQDSEVVIATGTKMVPPVDGRVEYVWDFGNRINSHPVTNEGKVDHRNRGGIYSVEPGSVLAHWHPPVPGQAGVDVFGKVKEPAPPRHTQFRIGEGVRLINGEQTAVAAIAGRPTLEGKHKRITVKPQLVIGKNVDMETGNINFKGDVIIIGNVMENLTVHAGGRVEVRGSVYHATICSGSDITIHKSLVGGLIRAGGDQVTYQKIISLATYLCSALGLVTQYVKQVVHHPSFPPDRSHGYIFKLIVDKRFPELANQVRELRKLLPSEKDSMSDQLWQTLDKVTASLLKENPLGIGSLAEAEELSEQLHDLKRQAEALQSFDANVNLYYAQNAEVEATGHIITIGALVYNSKLHAGRTIRINGECRGGTLSATDSISAKAIGSRSNVRTDVHVAENGFVQARLIWPNVCVRVGPVSMLTRKNRSNVKLQNREGSWQETIFQELN